LIALVIDCMVVMAACAGRRPSAVIKNAAKAKNTPATRPEPSTAAAVAMQRNLSITDPSPAA
jgi:hypothetical protein